MMSYEELAEHPDRRDPKGAVRLYMRVLHWLAEDREAATDMISLFLPKTQLRADGTRASGYALGTSDAYLVQRLVEQPQVMCSYFGGTPENGYAPAPELEPRFVEGPPTSIAEKEAKIFVRSGGKDNPTPVGLKRNGEGIWKIFNWSSLATGVKKTVAEAEDF